MALLRPHMGPERVTLARPHRHRASHAVRTLRTHGHTIAIVSAHRFAYPGAQTCKSRRCTNIVYQPVCIGAHLCAIEHIHIACGTPCLRRAARAAPGPTVWPHATCVSVTAQHCFDVSTSARPFTRPVALHRGAAAGAFILRLCAFLLGLCAFFLGLVDCLARPRPECNMCIASTPCCSRPTSALDRVDGSPPPSLPSPAPSFSGCACNAGRPVASGPADGARLLRRDAAALGRWADHRARGSFPTKGCGKGRAPGSEAARQAWRTFVFVCPQCAALVNRARALQQARRAGRPALVDGDGCASAHCSSDYRRLRFARSQRQVAAELSFGLRSLVRPPRAADERDVWALPDRAAQAAAAAALKRLPS